MQLIQRNPYTYMLGPKLGSGKVLYKNAFVHGPIQKGFSLTTMFPTKVQCMTSQFAQQFWFPACSACQHNGSIEIKFTNLSSYRFLILMFEPWYMLLNNEFHLINIPLLTQSISQPYLLNTHFCFQSFFININHQNTIFLYCQFNNS